MGLEELQTHILSIPGATHTVDLLRHSRQTRLPLKLALDAESCLDRLYGGYYPDWVCGGQWNKMETYLLNLITATRNSNIELVVFVNGCLETERLGDVTETMEKQASFVAEINRHITHKKKPPPKLWWISPAYLKSAILIILRNSNVKIVSTTENHRKEVARYIKKNNLNGLLADDPEYFCYTQSVKNLYSAHKLKLSFKGTLETLMYNPEKIFEALGIIREKFPIYLTVLGNHIIPKNELKDFHATLGNGPLLHDISEWMQSIKTLEPATLAEAISANEELQLKIINGLRYFSSVNPYKKLQTNKNLVIKSNTPNHVTSSLAEATTLMNEMTISANEQNLVGSVVVSDQLPSTSKKSDPTNFVPKPQYDISQKIESVALTRHKDGIMSSYIMQIFKQRHVLLPLLVEDLKSEHRHVTIFRPIRQRVYGLLFNLHHLKFLAKENKTVCPKIEVSESYMDLNLKQMKTDVVTAVEVGWPVPTIEKLWLGDGPEAKAKRLRAFFSIMKSDKTIFMQPGLVPQQFVVLGVVTRYLLHQKLLRTIEIEAIVAQVLLLEQIDPEAAQEIEVPNLSMKNVHLSQLFMEGVEMCLLANDACGSPIPYGLFNSSLFFNGKIFNQVLGELSIMRRVIEILQYKVDLMMTFERIKSAITEGIENLIQPSTPVPLLSQNPMNRSLLAPGNFGRIPLPPQHIGLSQSGVPRGLPLRHSAMPMTYLDLARNPIQYSRGPQHDSQYINTHRGQLQVAGTVTGTWGPPDEHGRVKRVSLFGSTNAHNGRGGFGRGTSNKKTKNKAKKPGGIGGSTSGPGAEPATAVPTSSANGV